MSVTVRPPDTRQSASPDEDQLLSFDELIAKYEKKVFNLILRHINDYDDAADLTQETFINAYRAYGRFRGDSKVYTWLCQIALNACKNRFRQRDRVKPLTGPSLDEPVEDERGSVSRDFPDLTHAPHQVFEQKELGQQIEAAIAALPLDYRTVVILRDLQGLSYQEIAEAAGLSLETVKTRLHRGRLMLRRRLEPYLRG
ncbi:MAG TPA: sigma-70 family RNA polymerase sigma factor [Armatimonadota bacterium]